MSDWPAICRAPQFGEEVGVLLEAQSASSNTPNPFAPELTYTRLGNPGPSHRRRPNDPSAPPAGEKRDWVVPQSPTC